MIDAVILDSGEAIKAFIETAAKMNNCDYDIDSIVNNVFVIIGANDKEQVGVALGKIIDDSENTNYTERDLDLLSSGLVKLSMDLTKQCNALGLFDEMGTLAFRPTGWLGGDAIVLTRNGREPV